MRLFGTLWMLLLFTGLSAGQADTLRVGVEPYPPFVIRTGENQFTGLSVDLWQRIAKDQGLHFVWVEYQDQLGLIRALDFEEIDLTINPIQVSEIRVRMFGVTQPFFISSIGVATTLVERSQLVLFFNNLFSLEFLRLIILLILVIFVFGTLLWLAERNQNHLQFRPGLAGLFDGLWWSAVTMTTVGYGDKAPRSRLGRTIAIIWMFTAIVIISGFTASIASTLTVSSLSTVVEQVDDLKTIGKVGSVYASNSEDFLRRNHIPIHKLYDSPEEALKGLAQQEIEVLLYDKTVLNYFISQLQLERKISLLPVRFNQQYRSFFFPKRSSLAHQIDPLLVREVNGSGWQEMLKKYGLRAE